MSPLSILTKWQTSRCVLAKMRVRLDKYLTLARILPVKMNLVRLVCLKTDSTGMVHLQYLPPRSVSLSLHKRLPLRTLNLSLRHCRPDGVRAQPRMLSPLHLRDLSRSPRRPPSRHFRLRPLHSSARVVPSSRVSYLRPSSCRTARTRIALGRSSRACPRARSGAASARWGMHWDGGCGLARMLRMLGMLALRVGMGRGVLEGREVMGT